MLLWYIDESGINTDERFVVAGGYCINDKNYEKIRSNFISFKKSCMPDSTRKMDMKSLLQGKKWAAKLTIDKRRQILEHFLSFLKEADIRIVISMIDRDYSPRIRNKLEFAYECLFERIVLNNIDISKKENFRHLSILFTDTLSNIKEVSSWFEYWYTSGTGYVDNDNLIEKIIPLKMSQSEMLQFSDMILGFYTYYRKFLAGQKSISWAGLLLKEGMEIIKTKAYDIPSKNGHKSFGSIKEYSYR